jgi:Zn-dependent peptidase ImmA (M78 family)
MEWQARGIAPRILMPPEQFDEMATRYIEEHSNEAGLRGSWYLNCAVVNSLADFFQVSKQSAEIRLNERGYYLRE